MSTRLSLIVALIVSAYLFHPIDALYVASGSSCAQACTSSSAGTLGSDVYCTDNDYAQSPNATHLRSCVECELRSARIDSSGDTDFGWAIYNLRYAFSTCVYGFPEAKPNVVSTPCSVSCAPIQSAIETGLSNQNATQDFTFCNTPAFTQTNIHNCANCYAIAGGQNTLSNFLNTLDQACVYRPSPGQLLTLNPTTVFSSSLIGPPSISPTPTPHHRHVANLPLVIALPILFFILLCALVGIGCFFLVRRRHRKVKQDGAIRRVQMTESAGNTPLSPYFSVSGYTPSSGRTPSAGPLSPSGGGWNGHSAGAIGSLTPATPVRGPLDYPAGHGFNRPFQGGYQAPTNYLQGQAYFPPPPSKPAGTSGTRRLIPSLVLPWTTGKNVPSAKATSPHTAAPSYTSPLSPIPDGAEGSARPNSQVFVYDPHSQRYVKQLVSCPRMGVAQGDPEQDLRGNLGPADMSNDRWIASTVLEPHTNDSKAPSIDLAGTDRKDIPLEQVDP